MAAPDLYCEEPRCGLPAVSGKPYLAGQATTDDPDRTVPVYFRRIECFGGHRYQKEAVGYVPPREPRPKREGGPGLLYACPNDGCEVSTIRVQRGYDASCPECGYILVAQGEDR